MSHCFILKGQSHILKPIYMIFVFGLMRCECQGRNSPSNKVRAFLYSKKSPLNKMERRSFNSLEALVNQSIHIIYTNMRPL